MVCWCWCWSTATALPGLRRCPSHHRRGKPLRLEFALAEPPPTKSGRDPMAHGTARQPHECATAQLRKTNGPTATTNTTAVRRSAWADRIHKIVQAEAQLHAQSASAKRD